MLISGINNVERQKREGIPSAATKKGCVEEVAFEIAMPLYLRVPSSIHLSCTNS